MGAGPGLHRTSFSLGGLGSGLTITGHGFSLQAGMMFISEQKTMTAASNMNMLTSSVDLSFHNGDRDRNHTSTEIRTTGAARSRWVATSVAMDRNRSLSHLDSS